MVCKVADFGMSRELSEEETYNTTVIKSFKPFPVSLNRVIAMMKRELSVLKRSNHELEIAANKCPENMQSEIFS